MVKIITVKYLCNLSGMSLSELADALGIHEQTLYKHQRNSRDLLTSPQCREVLSIMEKYKESPFEVEREKEVRIKTSLRKKTF